MVDINDEKYTGFNGVGELETSINFTMYGWYTNTGRNLGV